MAQEWSLPSETALNVDALITLLKLTAKGEEEDVVVLLPSWPEVPLPQQ
jgi:hypothetical protein